MNTLLFSVRNYSQDPETVQFKGQAEQFLLVLLMGANSETVILHFATKVVFPAQSFMCFREPDCLQFWFWNKPLNQELGAGQARQGLAAKWLSVVG